MRAKVSRPTVRKLYAAGKLKGAFRIADRWLQIPEEHVAFYLKEENRPRIGRPAAKKAAKPAAITGPFVAENVVIEQSE